MQKTKKNVDSAAKAVVGELGIKNNVFIHYGNAITSRLLKMI